MIDVRVDQRCPVCGADTTGIGSVVSEFSRTTFGFRRCASCAFTFVENPRTDFSALYDEEYYHGRGADTLVDYVGEMRNPRSIRMYEWRGLVKTVDHLVGRRDARWLDYGCGLGGLVRYARNAGYRCVDGFDEGWSAAWAAENHTPLLDRDQLRDLEGTFDLITAVEVIEHTSDPVAMMHEVARLLKPGGIFLPTTGNAQPHRRSFLTWSYVHPDVHVSYFEPATLAELYRRVGLEPVRLGFLPGHADIIRHKVLKTCRFASRGAVESLVPWALVSRVVDRRHQISAHPIARRPAVA